MKIEFLYFEGCGSFKQTLFLLEKILLEEDIQTSIKLIRIDSDEMARRNRFHGSPSIRVNGQDIERADIGSLDYTKKCRIYVDHDVLTGIPPEWKIRHAILEAKKKSMIA